MVIDYTSQDEQLKIGRPYTYGMGCDWFLRVSQTEVVFLGSDSELAKNLGPASSTSHINGALNWTGFRYARTMEID